MKVLFAISDLLFSEPRGVMCLSAMCKRHGHETKMAVIADGSFREQLYAFQPEIVLQHNELSRVPVQGR